MVEALGGWHNDAAAAVSKLAGQSHWEGGGGDYEAPVPETESSAYEGECSSDPQQDSFPCSC